MLSGVGVHILALLGGKHYLPSLCLSSLLHKMETIAPATGACCENEKRQKMRVARLAHCAYLNHHPFLVCSRLC